MWKLGANTSEMPIKENETKKQNRNWYQLRKKWPGPLANSVRFATAFVYWVATAGRALHTASWEIRESRTLSLQKKRKNPEQQSGDI